jgi:hypothetical protein
MKTARWKVLMAYLPGMASVVNSFQSPQVQLAVFESLMSALDEKTDAEDGLANGSAKPSSARSARRRVEPLSDTELTHDLVDGDSIHALMGN